MFRKALITIAAAVSMSTAAFAQYAPQGQGQSYPTQGGYGQNTGGGGHDSTQYPDGQRGNGFEDPRQGGYAPQNGGYAPQGQGGYAPQGQGGYGPGPQTGGYAPQGQGGYAPQQQQPNYPQQQTGPSIDMRSVQPGQSQQYRYMMPQGWRPIENSGMCLIASPDMTMAYGLIAPGTVQGTVSADAYMKDTLTRVAQFQNVQVLSGQRGQVQAPFTESGTFMITYTAGGAQYVGMINCAVAQSQSGTYGFLQVVFGTQQALQANGQPLMQLLQSVVPLNPPQGAPTNGGPVTNGPVTNGPVNSGPVNNSPVTNGPANNVPAVNTPANPNPAYQPASYPNPNPAPAANAGSVNPLER